MLVQLLLAAIVHAARADQTRILIMGDSWGTEAFEQALQHELKEHDCHDGGFKNIAVGGSTAEQWADAEKMKEVKKSAADSDLIWVTLMGNDAIAVCPNCAKTGKSAEACGDAFIEKCKGWLTTILTGIHEANPSAQVVGFGYDIMFGGVGCDFVTKDVFPQCWKEHNETAHSIRCFNTEFAKLTALWNDLSESFPFVHALNLLGATQAGAGYANVTVGHPDLDRWGPVKDWPLSKQCIHPSTVGGDKSALMEIMKAFYDQYWSKALSC